MQKCTKNVRESNEEVKNSSTRQFVNLQWVSSIASVNIYHRMFYFIFFVAARSVVVHLFHSFARIEFFPNHSANKRVTNTMRTLCHADDKRLVGYSIFVFEYFFSFLFLFYAHAHKTRPSQARFQPSRERKAAKKSKKFTQKKKRISIRT